MAMTVNTNLSSLNAQRNLASSQASLNRSMERLSSGLRVNGAKDDAAGLAIAERMNKDVRGMAVAMRNANDGISLAQTADSALGKVTESLQRMRELALQSANGTYDDSTDRANMQSEFSELASEITRVLDGTKFNGKALIGTTAADITFQVGTGSDTDLDQITITMSNLNDFESDGTTPKALTTALDLDSDDDGIDDAGVLTSSEAVATLDTLESAIDEVTNARANFGALQNRFEAAISTLQSASENTSAARSRIMDADFATESSNMARSNILQQASMAMLAQANQAPQQVMKLLQ